MNIYTFIPYSIEGNLGQAYNQCMGLVGKDDWALLLDHDVMLLQRRWYPFLYNVIEKYRDKGIGLYTCFTNRCGAQFQKAPGIDSSSHNLFYHISYARSLQDEYRDRITLLDDGNISGFFMLVSKKIWIEIRGAKKKGIGKVDLDLVKRLRDANIKIARLDGLYVYHYRRALLEGKP